MAAAPARRAPARKSTSTRKPTARKPASARRSTAPVAVSVRTKARAHAGAPARRLQIARRAHPRSAAVLDNLLYGRGWIALVFVLLAGIVFFNVDLLQMNRDIALTADRASKVKRENARLRIEIARQGSSERIQQVAADAGLVLPAPGEVRYLRADPSVDARRAATRIEAGETAVAEVEPVAAEPIDTDALAEEPVVTEPEPVVAEPVAVSDPAAAPPAGQ